MPPDPAPAVIRRAGSGATAGIRHRFERHARQLREPTDLAASTDRLRLIVYTLCLGIAFGLYLLVHGIGRGLDFWLPSLAASAAIAFGLTRRGAALRRPFRWGVAGAGLIAAAIPLAPALLAGDPLSAVIEANPLWPQILVTLFASRVLSEVCDLRFAAAWRAPLRAHAPVQIQSNAAAVALGTAFTLTFYQGIWFLAPAHTGATTLTAIVASALSGETAIHRSIVFLFFVILAYFCDATLHYLRDREALRALRLELASPDARPDGSRRATDAGHARLHALLAGRLAPFAHTRTVRVLREAASKLAGDQPAARLSADAFDGFHGASRRFVRGLLPFLPLLGFFGTVVGLATAMAALPTGGGGRVDLSGSLAGLALKFETTLLGILASMLASVLLSMLERGETELAAECALLVQAGEPHDVTR